MGPPSPCTSGGAHSFHTTCGRDVTVGLIAVGDAQRPARRVTVNIGECPDCHDGAWAALTVGEARLLAADLLTQADAAENAS
jgi:hypothetical protein